MLDAAQPVDVTHILAGGVITLGPAKVGAQTKHPAPGQILSPGHWDRATQAGHAGANTLAAAHAEDVAHRLLGSGNNLDSGHPPVALQPRAARVNTLTPVHISHATQRRARPGNLAPPTATACPTPTTAAQTLTPGHPRRENHVVAAGESCVRPILSRSPKLKRRTQHPYPRPRCSREPRLARRGQELTNNQRRNK